MTEKQGTEFTTQSGKLVKETYTPKDLGNICYEKDLGNPGGFPFTRGIHQTMYRGKPWTKRFYAGFGRPEETNKRIKFLLSRGQTGIIIVPDRPSQMGLDADHPFARGNVGISGYPMSSLPEMEKIFADIPLDKISVSLQWTTSAATVGLAAYVATGDAQGIPAERLRGSIYNDPIHAHFCTYELACPLELSLKLTVDIIEYCCQHMPLWHPVVPGGYELREWGITAAQELALVFAIALEYTETARRRGLSPDQFLPKTVFSMSVEMDLFEEAAKFRAARRIWTKLAKERLGAKDPRSYKLKISAKTSGSSLTAQQPINNVVRTTVQTLAAILGGVQVIEPCGYDEAYTIPTEESATVALNLQHILHHEGRLVNTVDPLGGSYYVEHLTNQVEEEALAILQKILDRGGIYAAVQQGWIKQKVRHEAIKRQKEIEEGERVLVGVNSYVVPKEEEIPLKIYRDKRLGEFSRLQEEGLSRLKEKRDPRVWRGALEHLREKAEQGEKENLILPIKNALQAQATMGEILGVIRETYGLSYDPLNMIDSPMVSLI